MSAPIEEFKVARRHGAGRAGEPGRHVLAAAPCTRTGQHGIALVHLFPEISAPRCLMVTPDERILVINRTGAFERRSAVPTAVHLGAYSAKLAPQQAAFFTAPVRIYLGTGLHSLRSSRSPGLSVLVVRGRCDPPGEAPPDLRPLKRCI
jgi:hypothetical protein